MALAQVHDEDGCELYALHQAKDRLVMPFRREQPGSPRNGRKTA